MALDEQAELDHLILKVTMDPGHGEKHSLETEADAVRTSVEYCATVLGAGAL
jgi:hypothetical protein